MALTNNQLLERIVAIEDTLNTVQVALNNLATKQQLKANLGIRQKEIDDLNKKVAELESQIKVLQEQLK